MKKLLIGSLFLLATTLAAADPTSFSVVVEGSGRPMILIPGLSSPAAVWDGTVARYGDRFQTHRLQLAGFAGSKPVEGRFLPTVRAELAGYIRANKLDRPIIVGHSLGGFLAYWIAATEPDLVGPIVVVDGLPAFGAIMKPDVTPEELANQAEMMSKALAGQNQEQFAAQTKMSMAGMITSRGEYERISDLAAMSDPSTVARAVSEMITTDLRKELKNIRSPLLLIAASGGMPESFASSLKDRYEAQVAAVPQHEVIVATKARHFVMLDDPDFFFAAVDRFLAVPAAARTQRKKSR